MGNLTTALIIVLMINAFMILGQTAITNINPGDATQFFNPIGSPLYTYATNGTVNGSNSANNLPSDVSSVDPNTGARYTDTWTTVKNWITGGLSVILSILTGPYLFLEAIGLPLEFTLIIGLLWYSMTIFLIVNWIKGGGGD